MTEERVSAPHPATGRGMKIALAASLALNLGIAGVVGGSLIVGALHHDRPMMVRDLGFGPFTDALSPEDRAALRASFLAEAGDFRAARREVRAEFAAFLAALRADPFDAEALRVVMAQQNARARDRMELGQRLLADRLAAMPPEARLAFADRLEARLSRNRGDRPAGD